MVLLLMILLLILAVAAGAEFNIPVKSPVPGLRPDSKLLVVIKRIPAVEAESTIIPLNADAPVPKEEQF